METNLNAQVSPSLHPQVITSIKGYEQHKVLTGTVDEAFAFAYDAVKTVVNRMEELRTDDLKTDKAKTQTLAKIANDSLQQIMQKFALHERILNESMTAIQQQLTTPLETQGKDGTLNAEIRAHVKSLTADERRVMLDSAMRSSDLTTCAAVLCAPAYLSGIDEKQQNIYLVQYHQAGSPEVVEKLNVLGKVNEVVKRTIPIAQNELNSLAAKLANQLNGDKSSAAILDDKDRAVPYQRA